VFPMEESKTGGRAPIRRIGGAAMLASGILLLAFGGPAMAEGDQAKAMLKAMSDYLAAQKDIAFDYDATIDVVTRDFEKLELASSGAFRLSRPNKAHVTRRGAIADVELFFDGAKLTVFARRQNAFADVPVGGSVGDLVDLIEHQYDVELPAADLFVAHMYDQLIEPVTVAKDLGIGFVGGVECEHLAFRSFSVDWEVWVRTGKDPIPCRYVITSKFEPAAPQYSIQFSNWRSGADAPADTFAFDNKAGATKVELGQLGDLNDAAVAGGVE